MKRIIVLAASILVLVHPEKINANVVTVTKSVGSYAVIDAYLKLLAKPWKKSPLEHAKTKEGRIILRKFVTRLQLSYDSALQECSNDPGYLNYILRTRWNYKMSYIFRSPSHSTNEIIEMRERLVGSLPYELKTNDSLIPNDPYVEDPLFFEKVFNLRTSWRSFNLHGNSQLAEVYQKYKELWMRQYATSKTFLSEAIYLWLEVTLERIVSIITEWNIHGVRTDQEDIWEIPIPSNVIPADVQNSFENDQFYQMRMFNHDLAKDSLLFYGLPVGTRLLSIVPESQVDFSEAQTNLYAVTSSDDKKIGNDDEIKNYNEMDYLGKIANQYLRALANKKSKEPPATGNGNFYLDSSACSRWTEPGNCNAKTNNAYILECAAKDLKQSTSNGDTPKTKPNSNDSSIGNSYWMKEIIREVLDECYDPNRYMENYSSRKKRDLAELSNLRYQKYDECRVRFNHYAQRCVERIHEHPVQDPSYLIHSGSMYGEDESLLILSCPNNQVLRVTDLDISRPFSFFNSVKYPFTLVQVGYLWNKYLSDLVENTLATFEKQCNNKHECPVHVNVKEMSDHRTFFDVAVNVKYECAPRGCNPYLYDEKTTSAERDEYLTWQCKNNDEGILITSVHWSYKPWRNFHNLLSKNLPDDSDSKSLEYLKSRCGGRNKCKLMANLKDMTGSDSETCVIVQVNYKCLPCAEYVID